MINFDTFKELYERSTGIILFNEEGNLEDFYREVNKIHKPVCGRWHANPIPLTAVKKPFCGIATIDITVLSHPGVWEETRAKMDQFATDYNGTSTEFEGNGTFYSVSYNIQTAGVGNRILDVNIGHGEVIELTQQLSLIIIESGVSAYDTHLYIDNIEVPILSLVETKTHTASMAPSSFGVVQTMSEQEAYGIDFVVPYMKDESGRMFRDVIDNTTGNDAHCVVLDVAGKKSCHIMQFAQATSNVQPPQNIGINLSMTEVNPSVAKFNGMWIKEYVNKQDVTVFVPDLTDLENVRGCTIFWGDGTYEDCDADPSQAVAKHIYNDVNPSHEVMLFLKPYIYYPPIEVGNEYYGKNLYFNVNGTKMPIDNIDNTVIATNGKEGNESGSIVIDNGRMVMRLYNAQVKIDTLADGKYYLMPRTKVQCFIKGNITEIKEELSHLIRTSLWDGDMTDGGGFIG